MLQQVLGENRMQNERRCQDTTVSLNRHRSRRTRVHEEMDAVSVALEAAASPEARLEHERKLEVLRNSLNSIEATIS